MLRGDNGIITKATETKYLSGISQFDEQTKLASMAVRTSIESNKISKAGYIATYNGTGVDDKNYFTGLVNEVAKELGVTATAGGSGTILREGYTVAYYLEKEGSTTQNGNGYIVIWYTDNGLRSTMDREKAITNYGLTDVASEGHKTANEAVLVTVIHVENYKSELAIKGITSLTDSDSDIGQPKFGDTTLNGQLGFSSSPTTNNTIQIVATAMSESEISEKGITRQQENSVIIKVKQQITKEQLKAMEQSETGKEKVQNMFINAVNTTGVTLSSWEEGVALCENQFHTSVTNVTQAYDVFINVGISVPENVSDAYDFIIQTGAYEDELEILKYICNINNVDIEKTGTEVFFELTDAKEYEIVAKDSNNNIVGTTTYTIESVSFSLDGTEYQIIKGRTWSEFLSQKPEYSYMLDSWNSYYYNNGQLVYVKYFSGEILNENNEIVCGGYSNIDFSLEITSGTYTSQEAPQM